jgi:hypothetical protein
MRPLTAERLRELLSYDPETGLFTRLVRAGPRGKAGAVVGTSAEDYLICEIDSRPYRLHRLAWLYMHGEWPAGEIDHINGSKADNRLANLRDVSRSMNQQNKHRAGRNNRQGFAGVTRTASGRFPARIKVDGALRHLGVFDTPEEAHSAWLVAKQQFHAGYVPKA